MRRRPTGICAIIVGALLALAILGLVAPAARAGQWIEVSCENPNGTAAGSQGWTALPATGSPSLGSGDVTTCGPGAPLSANLSSVYGPTPPGSAESLQYTPPAGSTLAGGTLQIALDAPSTAPGLAAVSEASVFSPAQTLSDRLISCIPFLSYCPTGTGSSTLSYTGSLALPADQGGGITVLAACDGSSPTSTTDCDQGAADNLWATAQIQSADLLLTSVVSPGGSGFSGSAIQRGARGTAHLVFTATDPGGPGVYSATVQLDGQTVWSGQPNDNGGACVAAGTDGSVLMFDSAQPCLTSETVDLPVPTTALSDGRHQLAVSVTDAAGNSSTVLDRTITTSNPRPTPLPRHGVRARFYLGWDWHGTTTRLDSAAVTRLPRRGRLVIACHGPGCPKFARRRATGSRPIHRLLRALKGRRFHAGDRLEITVSAAHRRTERIELTFRRAKIPLARLRKR